MVNGQWSTRVRPEINQCSVVSQCCAITRSEQKKDSPLFLMRRGLVLAENRKEWRCTGVRAVVVVINDAMCSRSQTRRWEQHHEKVENGRINREAQSKFLPGWCLRRAEGRNTGHWSRGSLLDSWRHPRGSEPGCDRCRWRDAGRMSVDSPTSRETRGDGAGERGEFSDFYYYVGGASCLYSICSRGDGVTRIRMIFYWTVTEIGKCW